MDSCGTVYSAKEKKIWFYVNGKLDVENKWGGNPGILDKAGSRWLGWSATVARTTR